MQHSSLRVETNWVFRKALALLFTLLAQHHKISADLAGKMKRMVGFRNVAVHDYLALLLPIAINITHHHLTDF